MSGVFALGPRFRGNDDLSSNNQSACALQSAALLR